MCVQHWWSRGHYLFQPLHRGLTTQSSLPPGFCQQPLKVRQDSRHLADDKLTARSCCGLPAHQLTEPEAHSEFTACALRASHSCPTPCGPLVTTESPPQPPAAHVEGVHPALQIFQLVSLSTQHSSQLAVSHSENHQRLFPLEREPRRQADIAFNFSRSNLDNFLEGTSSGSFL